MKKGNVLLALTFPIMALLSYTTTGSHPIYLWALTFIVWIYIIRDERRVDKDI